MTSPGLAAARELLAWEPGLGVVSVYLELDPGDRGGAWRTRLGNGVEEIRAAAAEAPHERKLALRETADRLSARGEALEPPLPRCLAGFLTVAARGAELWRSFQVSPGPGGGVHLGERALLAPLLDLERRSRPWAVALVSAERVRLLRWAPGDPEELADWELSLFSDDWRERNRERFLGDCGHRAAALAAGHGLADLVGFGPAQELERFASGCPGEETCFSVGGDSDLIGVPTGELGVTVAAALAALELERDRELAQHALAAARGGGRGSAGADETAVALSEGRVEHLLLDPEAMDGASPGAEPLIRGAVATGAAVTCVSPAASGVLAGSGGVAAVLRY